MQKVPDSDFLDRTKKNYERLQWIASNVPTRWLPSLKFTLGLRLAKIENWKQIK